MNLDEISWRHLVDIDQGTQSHLINGKIDNVTSGFFPGNSRSVNKVNAVTLSHPLAIASRLIPQAVTTEDYLTFHFIKNLAEDLSVRGYCSKFSDMNEVVQDVEITGFAKFKARLKEFCSNLNDVKMFKTLMILEYGYLLDRFASGIYGIEVKKVKRVKPVLNQLSECRVNAYRNLCEPEGLILAPIVDDDYNIIDGHHRFAATVPNKKRYEVLCVY